MRKKTEALWLGTCHDKDQPLLIGIDKVNKPIKILGVHFTYDLKKKQELNYDETLAGWKWQNLYGKIQVVKTFVILSSLQKEKNPQLNLSLELLESV